MKNETEQKIIEILEENYQLYLIMRYLIQHGAGTLIPEDYNQQQAIRIIALELGEALSEPRAGEWETELGQALLGNKHKMLLDIAKDNFKKQNQCPICHWTSRVIKTKKGYTCTNCHFKWEFKL